MKHLIGTKIEQSVIDTNIVFLHMREKYTSISHLRASKNGYGGLMAPTILEKHFTVSKTMNFIDWHSLEFISSSQ